MDLVKAYDKVNREELWQLLKIYDVGDKLFNGIKSMYDNSLVCVRVKGGESEWFRIDSGVRQGCIMSPWLFTVYMDTVMEEVKIGMGERFRKERREWRLPGLLYADDLVICGELEEDLRVMMGCFVEVLYRRRGLKVNAGKSKMMGLNEEEGLE